MWFSIRFSSFLIYSVHCTVTHYRNCKRFCEFEEIEILMQSCRGDTEKQGGDLLSGFRERIRPKLTHSPPVSSEAGQLDR